MTKQENSPEISLPRSWLPSVKSAMLQVISLAHFAMTYTRSWAVNSPIARLRLKAENERLCQQVAFLMEEIRIKDARMKRIDPYKRPHYTPTERLSILELRAANALSVRQTAGIFQVCWSSDFLRVPPENLIRAGNRGFGRSRRHLQLTHARPRPRS